MSGPSGLTVLEFRPIIPVDARKIIAAIDASYSATQQVADRPALAALDPANLKSGSLSSVALTREEYRWDADETTAPDGFRCIAGLYGPQNPGGFPVNAHAGVAPGRWILLETAAQYDAAAPINQLATIYVDEAAGNDQATGALGDPLASELECRRRWRASGSSHRPGGQVVSLAGNLTTPLIVDENAPEETEIVGTLTPIVGAPAALTVAAVTAIDRTAVGNNPLLIAVPTAELAAWGPYVGRKVRITASVVPANVGAVAYVVHDDGVSGPNQVAAVTPFIDSGEVVRTPQVGDTLDLVADCQVSVLSTFSRPWFQDRNEAQPARVRNVVFTAIAPSADAGAVNGVSGLYGTAKFVSCSFDANFSADATISDQTYAFLGMGCLINDVATLVVTDCGALLSGCGIVGQIQSNGTSAAVQFQGDCVASGNAVIQAINGNLSLRSICAWYCALDFVRTQSAARFTSPVTTFYGQHNVGTLWLLGNFTRGSFSGGFAGCVATTAGSEIASTTGNTWTFAAAAAAGGVADVQVDLVTGIPDPALTQSILSTA